LNWIGADSYADIENGILVGGIGDRFRTESDERRSSS